MTQTKCPVCEATLDTSAFPLFQVYTGRGEQTWRQCPRCRSFSDTGDYHPVSEVEHTRTRPWGQAESGVQLNEFKENMFRAVLRLLRRYARPGATLLDVGCSYGGFLTLAKAEGYDARGYDIVPEAAERVRDLGISCDVACSMAEIKTPDASLDIISVLDCNCYWPDQIGELKAIRQKLRPNGLLVMRVVDKSWLLRIGLRARKVSTGIGDVICRRAVNDHRVSIPVRSFLRILRDLDFEILYAAPKGALHSERSQVPVKLAFLIGAAIWPVCKRNFAPGFLICARKSPDRTG